MALPAEASIPSEPPASLTNLPHELTLQILDELDTASLCDLGSTCKDLNALVFPYFFQKHEIKDPLNGSISHFGGPRHTLRAIRSCLPVKDVLHCYYFLGASIENLVEEVEELRTIMRRSGRVARFDMNLWNADNWSVRRMCMLDEGDLHPTLMRLTEQEWTKVYLGLLTAALTNGCESAQFCGGGAFLGYLRHRAGSTMEGSPSTLLGSSQAYEETPRYFDGTFRYKSPFADQPKQSSKSTVQCVDAEPENISTVAIVKDRKRPSQPQLSTTPHSMGPPKPKIKTLTLQTDMFFASYSFLDWTRQLLAWCAPSLTNLCLLLSEASSVALRQFLSTTRLPSLTELDVTCTAGEANMTGTDVLFFLATHPSIQKLCLHGVQVPAGISPLSVIAQPFLPSLVEVTAHPIYIQWLLRNKEQCPRLKQVTLPTERYANRGCPFTYDMLDRALENLVPHSHKLDLIIFSFAKDHADLDSWLQSHIDAGPDASIPSSFIDTKRLRIDAEYSVKIINVPPRLELVAQFVGLFPNLQILELQRQPGLVNGRIPPMVQQTVRLYCPQVKKVTINGKDISEVEQSKEG